MRVLHSSDLHGKYKRLLNSDLAFDVWLDTGDFLDNVGRSARSGMVIAPALERSYQAKLLSWKDLAARFRDWLAGRPAILVRGNHDFITFGRHLIAARCPNVHLVDPEGVDVAGLRWAGFREIPQMTGEWAGELSQAAFIPLVERTWASKPDVLVTHAPASGRLDVESADETCGIDALREALKQPTTIRHHFFGHNHAQGGQILDVGGVRSINGATKVVVHVL
jgi:hypothetical protein